MLTQSTTHYNASVRVVAASHDLALYGRVSGDRQEKEATIESQVAEMRAAVAACGGRIKEEYLDNPYTGTVAHRPALDRLMKDAGKTFTHLLIFDPDRLARGKPYLRPMLEEELRDMGVTLAYLTYEMEDSAEGRAKDGMTTVFNEWLREKIILTTQRGARHKREQGYLWRSKRPYGWCYLPPETDDERHGHLIHHPDEAPIVREIMERTAAGESSYALAADLNRRGILTTNGNLWSASALRNVLHNPLHSGRTPINRYYRRKPDQNTKRRVPYPKHATALVGERPRDEWEYPDPDAVARNGVAVDPIVPVALQDAAEAALSAGKRRSRRNAKHTYLLRGLAYCMAPRQDDPLTPCGRGLHACKRSSRPSWYYRCSRYYASKDDPTRCKTHVDGRRLEQAVWSYVTAILQDPDMVRRQWEITQEAGAEERERAERTLARAQEAYSGADAAVTALILERTRGKLSEADFDRTYAQLCRERDEAHTALQDAQARVRHLDPLAGEWENVAAWLHELRGLLALAEQPGNEIAKERLIHAVVQRIEYDGRGWWLWLRWGGEAGELTLAKARCCSC